MIIIKETFSLGFICLKMVQLNRPRLGLETLDLKIFFTTLLISNRPVRFLCNLCGCQGLLRAPGFTMGNRAHSGFTVWVPGLTVNTRVYCENQGSL
jgi:hypothetical protein